MRILILAAAIAALCASLSACKLIKNDAEASGTGDASSAGEPFDPDRMARELWEAKVLPYLDAKAGDFTEIRELAGTDPDAAGRRFGYREEAEGRPWMIVTRLEGEIVKANTGSRAATIDVDADADGKADAAVQIGPVVRGTALRDSLDFVDFGDFTNQIEYAEFGKSLNTLVNETMLGSLPREALVGRHVTVLGVFELDPSAALPLITPARIAVSERPP